MYSYEQGQDLYDELLQINIDLKKGSIDLKVASELNNNCGKRVQIHRNQIAWYALVNNIRMIPDNDEDLLPAPVKRKRKQVR